MRVLTERFYVQLITIIVVVLGISQPVHRSAADSSFRAGLLERLLDLYQCPNGPRRAFRHPADAIVAFASVTLISFLASLWAWVITNTGFQAKRFS